MTAPAVKQVHVSEVDPALNNKDPAGANFGDTAALMLRLQNQIDEHQAQLAKIDVLMKQNQSRDTQVPSLQSAQVTATHSSE